MMIEVQFASVEKIVTGSLLIEIAPVPYSASTRGHPGTPSRCGTCCSSDEVCDRGPPSLDSRKRCPNVTGHSMASILHPGLLGALGTLAVIVGVGGILGSCVRSDEQ